MFTRPSDLPDTDVAAALLAGWGLAVDELNYAVVGFGSHHWRASVGDDMWFVTVDDLDVRQRDDADDRQSTAERIITALDTARALQTCGLDFVIASSPTLRGETTHRINDRYLAALFVHVDGETHKWGPYETAGSRRAVLDRLIELHDATPVVQQIAKLDDFIVPARHGLVTALANADATWGPGPFAENARRLLAERATDVRDALARYDDLVRIVSADQARFVVTHGEPHRANTINTADGVALIDWDTALLAPPERDLWMLLQEDPHIAAEYTARTGVSVDPATVRCYELWWDICEIALFSRDLRAPHQDTDDMRVVWDSFRHYLSRIRRADGSGR